MADMRGSFTSRQCALQQILAVEACSDEAFPCHSHEDFGIGRMVGGAQKSWSGQGMVEAAPGSLIDPQRGRRAHPAVKSGHFDVTVVLLAHRGLMGDASRRPVPV